MMFSVRKARQGQRARPGVRLRMETLETRNLPSGIVGPGQLWGDVEPNDVLSPDVPALSSNLAVAGNIGNGAAGAADVDWYTFTLASPAQVDLTALDLPATTLQSAVISLYNSALDPLADPFNPPDPFNPLGYRLLDQGEGHVEQLLGPGTYFVAVSGQGNQFFHPFLANSGIPGSTGDYRLAFEAQELTTAPGDGPAVLTSEPAAGSQLQSSPFVIRVSLGSDLDPTTVALGTNVQLVFNAGGTFGNGQDQIVPLAKFYYAANVRELQLTPAAPLGPGYYQIFLAGNQNSSIPALVGTNLAPLGKDAGHPDGADFRVTFHITGTEGRSVATTDDTVQTASSLGNVSNSALVQVSGAIGDDPSYRPGGVNPLLANPASDVDLYHFRVNGSGRFTLTAEVFAGRIGSPLDPGLTLYYFNPASSQLELKAIFDNSLNDIAATNGKAPLYNDPVLYAALEAGDYYLAVSSTGNLPAAGIPGVFDPLSSHSGTAGTSRGDYVLNLLVTPDNEAPVAESLDLQDNSTLAAPPTLFAVRFSEPVNLGRLDFSAYQGTLGAGLDAVFMKYMKDGNEVIVQPRLLSYDRTTGVAQFLMLEALPNGPTELHLSGPLGLSDFAGNALTGNDPSGDFFVHFDIQGPPRPGDFIWKAQPNNNSLATAQELGALYPKELEVGVKMVRTATPGATDTADFYKFEVLQARTYTFTLSGFTIPRVPRQTLLDAAGNPPPRVSSMASGRILSAILEPGTYILRLDNWTPANSAAMIYTVKAGISTSTEGPTPLTNGPAPAFRIQLVSVPPGNNNGGGQNGGGNGGSAGGQSPGTSSQGSSSQTSSLPAGALLGLSASTVGGVRRTDSASTSTTDRLALRGTETVGRSLQLVTTTTQSGVSVEGNGGGTEAQEDPLQGALNDPADRARLEKLLRALEDLGKQQLDQFYGNGRFERFLREWMKGLISPQVIPVPAPEQDSAEEETEDQPTMLSPAQAAAPSQAEDSSGQWSLVNALGGVLVLGAVLAERKARKAGSPPDPWQAVP